MKLMTKRIINIRVMTSVVIGLIAGILVGYSFSVDGIKTYEIVLLFFGLLFRFNQTAVKMEQVLRVKRGGKKGRKC